MSKELTPLEALEILKEANTIYCGCASNLFARYRYEIETIETALKDYENLKLVAKPLTDEEKKSINSVARRLKALEIIKEKRVDVCYFMNCRTLEEYNDDVLASYAYEKDDAEQRMLTQEEFDLLKEVLK